MHEQAAAFALDALDRRGGRGVRAAPGACPDCEDELEELRFAAAALAFAVEPPVPRPSCCGRASSTPGAQVIPLRRRRRPLSLAAAMVAAAACAVVVAAVRPWDDGRLAGGFRRYDAKGASATLLVSRSGEAVLAARRLPPLRPAPSTSSG